jgi:hypothetical protein
MQDLIGRIFAGPLHRLAHRGSQPAQQCGVSVTAQCREHLGASGLTVGHQRSDQGLHRRAASGVEAGCPVAEPFDEHVGVPYRPQRPAKPTQLGAQFVGPGSVQQWSGRLERSSHPPYCDPHLMQLFGSSPVRVPGSRASRVRSRVSSAARTWCRAGSDGRDATGAPRLISLPGDKVRRGTGVATLTAMDLSEGSHGTEVNRWRAARR